MATDFSTIPVRSNDTRIDASWFNTIRSLLVTYSTGETILQALASQTDNVDVNGYSILRVGGSSAVTFNGLSGGEVNQMLFLINETTSGDDVTLVNNSGSGTQKLFLGGDDVTLAQYNGVALIFNGTAWVLATGAGSGASNEVTAVNPIDDTDSPYTVTADDHVILCDDTSGNITVNLPTASGIDNRLYVIKKTNSSTNTITIDPNGSETIDGSATFLMYDFGDSVRILSDGTNWHII